MTSAVIVVVALVALSSCLWRLMRSSGHRPASQNSFDRTQNEIDVDVLNQLLSIDEDRYLRASLPDREFRQTKRQRIRLAWQYLDEVERNTRHLVRIVESARSSKDPEVAQAANELLQTAFRVRLNIPIVKMSLLTEWFWPTLRLRIPIKIDRYREMITRAVFILQRLEAGQSEPASEVGNPG